MRPILSACIICMETSVNGHVQIMLHIRISLIIRKKQYIRQFVEVLSSNALNSLPLILVRVTSHIRECSMWDSE